MRLSRPAIAAASVTATVTAAAGTLLVWPELQARQAAERMAAAALESLLRAIDANDPDTGVHVRRVAEYALILADAAGLPQRARHRITRVALFHDIGKIHEALFDITHDVKRLSPAERRAVTTHPRRGADVLQPLAGFYPELQRDVLAHHERWNGRGYPNQLKGRRIPLPARIVAIADTFDAIIHHRRYDTARSTPAALEVIAAERGRQFDPDLTDVFLSPAVQLLVCAAMQPLPLPDVSFASKRQQTPVHTEVPDVAFRWHVAAV
jgi:HD-GYP domain-containing protein (c-di-GMP phosphodiesterase class II)